MEEKSIKVGPNAASTDRRKTNFSTDILKLLSGTAASQVLSILVSPFIARLFSPDAFGINALFLSIVGLIFTVSTLQYEIAIILPNQDSDAANLMAGGFGLVVLFSLLTIPIVWFSGDAIANWLNAPELAQYLWLVPTFVFFGGMGAGHPILTAWASRSRHFSQVSATQVVGTTITMLMKLALGFLGFNTGGSLIAGSLVGSTVSPVLLGLYIWKRERLLFLENIRLPVVWKNLKRYRKFAIFNTPSAFLNNISWQVPSFMLAFYFSPTIVGYYSFGNQLLRVPMSLIGGSIGQAFYSHAATAHQQGKLAEFVEATFRRLVEYSFFPILMLTVMGRELCVVVFGNDWAEAGVYIQILSLWMVFWFISSPMSRLYNILERNELSLWLNIMILVTRVVSIWAGGVLGNPRLALLFFSLSGALTYGYLSVSIIVLSGVSWRKVGKIIFNNIALFVPAGGAVFLLNLAHISDWLPVILATLFVGIYFIYRFKDNDHFKQFLLQSTSLLGRTNK